MSTTNLFANTFSSRKDYEVSIAQKQHRGARPISSCGSRAAWGAKVRLNVASSHSYGLLALHQFLLDHTLDLLLSFIAMFCHL